MSAPAQVMVVSPHPDDTESRTAGAVVRWVRQGKAVIYVVCPQESLKALPATA